MSLSSATRWVVQAWAATLATAAPLLCQAPAGPPASAPAVAAVQAPVLPFSLPETFTYSVSWRIFPAGEATMHLERQGNALRATIRAVSAGFVSRLYKVDDTLVSRFDGDGMCAQGVLKTLHEGRRHRETRIDFDTQRKVAAVRESDLAKNQPVRQAEHAIPECVHDVVSALYHVRTRPLEVGKSFQLQINDGGPTLAITVEVQAREEVQTPAGKFHAIRLEPKVFGGTLFRRSGRMQIWLTDDPQRTLVQLKARLFWGTITAVLEKAERR